MIIHFKHFYRYLLFVLCGVILLAGMPVIFAVQSESEPEHVRLPVLMYNHLLQQKSKLNKYTISPEEFEADLEYLTKKGYTTVLVQDLIDFVQNGRALPNKPVMITFDDGYQSVYTYAFPLLQKYNMKAVVNVIGKQADLYSQGDDHSVNYAHMTWEELKTMQQSGLIEVQNHTYDLHKSAGRNGIQKKSDESLSAYEQVITQDLSKTQDRIETELGNRPTAFAYPFGKISRQALPILKKIGFQAVFCCWERVNVLTGDPEELYHLNRFNRAHNITAEQIFRDMKEV